MGVCRPNAWTNFDEIGMQQQVKTAMTVMRSNIKIFKIQNGGRPPCWKYIRNAITRLPMDRLEHNLGGHIPSYPDMSAMTRLPWQQPLPTNGALNILQLWASGGRTREPISIKFGTQQHVRTTMTVVWSNVKIFETQKGGRPPCWKILEIP